MSEKADILDYVIAEHVMKHFHDWVHDNISLPRTLKLVDDYIEQFLKEFEP